MQRIARGPALLALAALLASCSADETSPLAPSNALADALATVRINEIHYDNDGTDTGEAIEIAGPAGTDLTGWTLLLYNGSNGEVYNTRTLSGQIPATCDADGVVVISYPSNGIQNGAPDGIALVDAEQNVVEFLSYEGTLTATNGPAATMTSTDIGVFQTDNPPLGESLQRNGFGGWDPPAPHSFGACNGSPPPPYDGPVTVTITEIHGDPLAADSDSWGEWFEVYNHGAEPVNLGGWTIITDRDPEHTIASDVEIAPGEYVVLGRGADVTRNGYVPLAYNYFTGNATTIWLDASDWLVLRAPDGTTADSVRWTSLPEGATKAVRDLGADNADVDGANWGYSTTPFGSGDFGTPNAPNTGLADAPPPVPTGTVRIEFAGRDLDDPPLPVGFEDQLFAFTYAADGSETETTTAWEALDPAVATIDARGVMRAHAAGTARFQVTTGDGRIGIYTLPTRIATLSTTAVYDGNAEFGIPTDATPQDDFVLERNGITLSYSPVRNTPNWVSYDLEATHFGPEDRCDCFTADPGVPTRGELNTADYTDAGAYHGYGIDRGHLVRSADRTAGSLDNAYTFYFSNIIPQAADNNQGPWGDLEIALGNRARAGAHEVYVLAGVAGELGTLKDEGKVVIPASVWKVAVIMDRDEGLDDVAAPGDFELVVVDMPNVAGIRQAEWTEFASTVDALEAKTGYDLLDLLPDHIEWLVEAGFESPADASAAQLIEVLDAAIAGYAGEGVLFQGTASALASKLAEAEALLASGNTAEAAGAVRALERQVDALVRSGRLGTDHAAALQAFAGWIIAAIG